MRRQCRENRPGRDEALCIASALPARRQFMGEGKAKYTPEPAALSADSLPPSKKAAVDDVGIIHQFLTLYARYMYGGVVLFGGDATSLSSTLHLHDLLLNSKDT